MSTSEKVRHSPDLSITGQHLFQRRQKTIDICPVDSQRGVQSERAGARSQGHQVAALHQLPVRHPGVILQNVYRVLLTRGRDGFIVFVPPDPRFDATAQMLESAGVMSLSVATEEVEGAVSA